MTHAPPPDAIARAPRLRLAHLPTPLEPLDALRNTLGVRARLWIKRDDCTGLATGGNKTRKLEFLMGEAQADGATAVMTFGALQSNHARQTAAAAARAGLACELVLTRRVRYDAPAYEGGGNMLLDRVLGARVHIVDSADEAAEVARARRAAIKAAGGRLYSIPAGGSNVTGALGYVSAAYELLAQFEHQQGKAPDVVVHASSSGGTQAGLVCGLLAAGAPTRVLGINTYEPERRIQDARVTELSVALAARLGLDTHRAAAAVAIDHDHVGEDYGLPTEAMRAAVELLARTEGVLLDPVYSGKGFAGLLTHLRSGTFDTVEHVVFVHTGGAVSLPVYAAEFPAPAGE